MVEQESQVQRKTGYGPVSNSVVGIENTTQQDALADLIASLSNGSEKSDSSDTNTSSAWNAQVTSLTIHSSFHFIYPHVGRQMVFVYFLIND